jgi:hypothetical protein
MFQEVTFPFSCKDIEYINLSDMFNPQNIQKKERKMCTFLPWK